jgi:predicted site-specific integrase-resolvase
VAAASTVECVAEYLDLETVAEILGVRRYTAYVLVRTGDLRAMKLEFGWRVERGDVSRYRDGQ